MNAPRTTGSAHPRPHAGIDGRRGQGPAVVALGGGHGLAANLRALRHLSDRLTAVVTVADNGGSSGRIRDELPVLPPGDLRMALAALCEDSDWGDVWRDVVQHRFRTGGELDGHAVGNLLIVAMWQILGDPVAGLDKVGELLGARGRVLPMALEPLDIEARMIGREGASRLVRGQAEVAVAQGRVEDLRLVPSSPAVPPEVIEAISSADWLIIGPGSWYTSVLPHLMVPELADAIRRSPARRCITMNLASRTGETEGMASSDLLDALLDRADGISFDAVIADPTMLEDCFELAEHARRRGIRTVLRQVSVGGGVPEHDSLRLAAAYRDVFDAAFGDVPTDGDDDAPDGAAGNVQDDGEEDTRGADR
ncbi:gluconeogenesis factor YvcK family protein [Brachybacterium huguangmaarense]